MASATKPVRFSVIPTHALHRHVDTSTVIHSQYVYTILVKLLTV